MSPIKRPLSLSIFAVALAVLSLSAFLNAAVWPVALQMIPWQEASTPPNFKHMIESIRNGSWYLVATTLFYGISALWASIGIWKVEKWAPRAFFTWILAVMVIGIVMMTFIRSANTELTREYIVVSIGVLAVTLLVLVVLLVYIRSKIRKYHNEI